ncbi:hypothetical protein TNCV_1942381 [Trichonephila clavipes]|nr:hypothetical protein TNCV_1942381 [Trichonephila clavipes]
MQENPIRYVRSQASSCQKKRETKWFLLTKASLIWDSKNTKLSRVDRPCGIHSEEEKNPFLSPKHILNEYLSCVQRSCRSSSSEQWDGNSEDLLSPCPPYGLES